MKKTDLKEIVSKTDSKMLKSWILEYAEEHPSFAQTLIEKFNPVSLKKDKIKDYPFLIKAAFDNNPYSSGSRYNDWVDFGYDAENVRADLEAVLNDVDYFLKFGNTKIAVQICKDMIELIPEEWEEQFDYDGDVQVMYDEAIDKLEEMLQKDLLLPEEKKALFEWYKIESKNTDKHRYVGLNTELDVLQQYFLSSDEMITENLKSLNQKIEGASESYYKESYIIQKIKMLQNLQRTEEVNQTIDQYIDHEPVRKIRLNQLLDAEQYSEAIKLIQDGIKVAEKMEHPGTIINWKDDLLSIYLLLKDDIKILKLAEELLYTGRTSDKYYAILLLHTHRDDWEDTLNRILSKLNSGKGIWGFNEFRAKLLIEHHRWEELFVQCQNGGVNYLEKYEKYFRPQFDSKLYDIYLNFAQEQATITDQKAYENVGSMLKNLKTFEGGKDKVNELISEYRVTYKRRKNMMKVLDEV
ncbi:MAG: hypothetical protein WCY18_08325 [Methanofastidiosum sp.]